MSQIFIVVARGGEYEDSWEQSLCAFGTKEKAEEQIEKYERWLDDVHNVEFPENCEELELDVESDYAELIRAERRQAFKVSVLTDMGVNETDGRWLMQYWDSSPEHPDYPQYRVDEIELR